MEHTITRIDKLEGASNWSQWRFQICNMLRTQVLDGRSALGVITGAVVPPTPPEADAGQAAVTALNSLGGMASCFYFVALFLCAYILSLIHI